MLEDKMNNLFGDDAMDLGSSDFGGMFEDTDLDKLFGGSDDKPAQPEETPKMPVEEDAPVVQDSAEAVSEDETPMQELPKPQAETIAQAEKTEVKNEEPIEEPKAPAATVQPATAEADKLEDDSDIYASALANAEEKETENAKSRLMDKLPIFVYKNAKEEIVDTSIVFDELRKQKREDFPDFDNKKSLSWKVTYGKISRMVEKPDETTIASVKRSIEDSKEFLEEIKKSKGDLQCEVTAIVRLKDKGVMAAYKGLFETVEAAQRGDKAISYVPSENGKVYEIRSTPVGTFIAQTKKVSAFNKVRAGFIPALPKIPFSILSEIVAFFKSLVANETVTEALVYILWSKAEQRYLVYVPKQEVTENSVHTSEIIRDDDNYINVMDVHSHNVMPAYFSQEDDMDERGTGLYSVIGKLDKVFPDILVRISVGGKFVEIPVDDVFSGFEGVFPEKWKDAVTVKAIKEQEETK